MRISQANRHSDPNTYNSRPGILDLGGYAIAGAAGGAGIVGEVFGAGVIPTLAGALGGAALGIKIELSRQQG